MTALAFIRGLLENVGAEIDPVRLIRRIKNGLEIPGLKPALIKILQDFNLQISLLEGCQTILGGDCTDLVKKLHKDQTSGFLLSGWYSSKVTSQLLITLQERRIVQSVRCLCTKIRKGLCCSSYADMSCMRNASTAESHCRTNLHRQCLR